MKQISLAALLMVIMPASQAAIINVYSGNASYLSGIENNWLGKMDSNGSKVVEDFDTLASLTGLIDDGDNSGNGQTDWESRGPSIGTAVGLFEIITPGRDHWGDDEPGSLMIESRATGEFGRQVLAENADDFWLDSNDAAEVKWTITGDSFYDGIGFYLSDPNDISAFLTLSYSDGSSAEYQLNSNQPDASMHYVTVQTELSISGASLSFINCDHNYSGSNCDPLFDNDGWGIDDVAIGRVPEPTQLALMAIGLVGMLASSRRKKA